MTFAARTASNAPAVSAGDPYFANVKLLLHMDSSGFPDVIGSTITNNFGVALAASPALFSSSAQFIPASFTFLQSSLSSSGLLSGDFTLEAWVYYTNVTLNSTLFSADNGFGPNYKWFFALNYNGANTFSLSRYYNTNTNVPVSWSWTPTINTGYQICVQRSGNTYTFFVNGVSQGNVTDSTAIPALGQGLVIGGLFDIGNPGGAGGPYLFIQQGYIDEFRFTDGIARYPTTGYTPAVIPFPNHG